MVHDRVHAQPPHDPENWQVGTIRDLVERDGHAVFVVAPAPEAADEVDRADGVDQADGGERADGNDEAGGSEAETGNPDAEAVELVVTLAVRDLVCRRLDADEPVGQRVWFRPKGGG
jgi:hypothetical protein